MEINFNRTGGLKIHKSTIGLTGQNDIPVTYNLKLMDFQFGVFHLSRSRDLGKSCDPLTSWLFP